MARFLGVLGLLLTGAGLCCAQVAIIDSGSTNIPGVNVTLQNSGPKAMVERRGGAKQQISLAKGMCERLLEDLKAAGPLNELPAKHCAKSVSFGTSLFIEYKGVRSPDLSCQQSDPRAAALKKDASEIMGAARTYMPRTSRPM
jgi:hypothetical protein